MKKSTVCYEGGTGPGSCRAKSQARAAFKSREKKGIRPIAKPCAHCGQEFLAAPSCRFGTGFVKRPSRVKYCSEECKTQAQYKRNKTKPHYIAARVPETKDNCVVCCKEFIVPPQCVVGSKKPKVTCSKECYFKHRRNVLYGTSYEKQTFTLSCLGCGKDFQLVRHEKDGSPAFSGKQQKHCSKKCYSRWKHQSEESKKYCYKKKYFNTGNLTDQYIAEQIQKKERRSGHEVTTAKEISQIRIETQRISILAHRGEQLDKNLSDREKVKQFEETLCRTLRSNTAILPH